MEKIYLSHKMQKRFSLTAIYIFMIRNISSKLEIKLNFYNLKFPEANNKYHIQISYKLWYKPFLWDQEWNKDAHQWHFYLAMIFLFLQVLAIVSDVYYIYISISIYVYTSIFIHMYTHMAKKQHLLLGFSFLYIHELVYYVFCTCLFL